MKKSILFFYTLLVLLKIQAQDYMISFAGSGATANVGTIKVDNLTSGATVTLNGSDILHLSGSLGFGELKTDDRSVQVFPNPLIDQSTLTFVTPGTGDVSIRIVDFSGKIVNQITTFLFQGLHKFNISGVSMGVYQVIISGQNFTSSAKIVSLNRSKQKACIEYISAEDNIIFNHLKSTLLTVDMKYKEGDLMLYKGVSGIYTTIVTDVPVINKTITFNFVDCTDASGNHYPTVKIGTQTWTAENLKTTKFRNGNVIPNVSVNTAWSNVITPALCFIDDNPSYIPTYGNLYNWFAVSDIRNICPVGWHVSTEAEWALLVEYLGGANVAGGKLKETGKTLWGEPNTGATNESGFSARPGDSKSLMAFVGPWPGNYGWFWTSTVYEPDTTKAYNRNISKTSQGINRVWNDKRIGNSVRLVKD